MTLRLVRGPRFSTFCTLRTRLTVGQRAFVKCAYDALDPDDLTGDEREAARKIFGDVEHVPSNARRVIVQVKGREIGGTRLGAERCAHLGLTAPLDRIEKTELAYVVHGGPLLRHARIGLRFALAALKQTGVKIIDTTQDHFTIERPDGRRVRFECLAASRAGDTARGVPIIGALLDEASFYRDEASGVVNDAQVFSALIPRLLPGGQILIVSSPWSESGLLYTQFVRNHGKPSTALAAHCPTALMRDDMETLSLIESERERDPDNARREFDAEFVSTSSAAFFDGTAIESSIDHEQPLTLPAQRGASVVAACDLAFRSDSSALVICRADGGLVRVAEVVELSPSKGVPLQPSVVIQRFVEVARRHGAREIMCDGHYVEAVREYTDAAKMTLLSAPGGVSGKVRTYVKARAVLHEGKCRFSPQHRRLLQQLRDVQSRPAPGGGLQIIQRRSGASHGDVCSAWVLAAFQLSQRMRAGTIKPPKYLPPDPNSWIGQKTIEQQQAAPSFELEIRSGRAYVKKQAGGSDWRGGGGRF